MIDGRVKALARAHDQITDDHWGPAPLHGLIEGEAAACLTDSPRAVVIEGEPVLLNPQAYSTVALVIHELVTNSAKYGSLSNDGQVTISWHRSDDRDLQIDWVESGGPPVAPPTRKGIGTTIIEHSIPYDLGGVATLDYRPGGLTACFIIPERHLARPGDLSGNRNAFVERELPTELVRGDLLDGVGVLLVEDSLIIALDAEDILKRLGASRVSTQGSVDDALRSIRDDRPDIAVVDINLGDHDSFAIADTLNGLRVPFMFATGHGEKMLLPVQHRARIVLQKPYTLASFARRLPELLAEVDTAATR